MKSEIQVKTDDRLRHIAIIMDGNGRWATGRGLPREAGHKQGANAFRKIIKHCEEIGLKALTVYAFSTENWKRPQKEINSIISLLEQYVGECEKNLGKYNIYYHFIGDHSRFDDKLRQRIDAIERKTEHNAFTLNIAFNYGGRSELAYAFEKLAAKGKTKIGEEDIAAELYTAHSGDPDLIIRTGGDFRISNFLLWQAAYAELYFTDVLWPDFGPEELDRAICDFYSRKRRYGGV